jgi:putative ABC transport system ATP-binding protein
VNFGIYRKHARSIAHKTTSDGIKTVKLSAHFEIFTIHLRLIAPAAIILNMQIDVQNLDLQLGDFRLHVAEWKLPAQSQVLIEGPSGTGKTTFLHLLSGLMPSQKGKIRVGTFQLQALSSQQLAQFRRENCGIIFQKIHLLPHLTLQENVLLGCKKPQQFEKFAGLMKSLQLEHRTKHLPSALSLGETQRAAVARAVISEPEIIFADEPTSGLDDVNAERVLELLKAAAKNKTIIVVSHDHRARALFSNRMDFRELLK